MEKLETDKTEALYDKCNPEYVPSQGVFDFDNIKLFSNFDSANLRKAKQVSDFEFNLYIAKDCYKTKAQTTHCTWFYFGVQDFAPDQPYTFNFKNANKQSKLLKEGLKPVYKTSPGEDKWRRIPGEIFNIHNMDQGIKFSFSFVFDGYCDKVYFAYSFPFSYQDNQFYFDRILKSNAARDDIYIRKETPLLSTEDRELNLITLTSVKGKTEERERKIEGLFNVSETDVPRPFIFENKKYIFLSSRVHPGETAASIMLNGLINYLVSDPEKDIRVKLLLDNFVFVIVPLLNPDGVYRGHYRVDTNGNNLNRLYTTYTKKNEPSIYLVNKIVKDLSSQKRLYMYLDFHAHANINNIFMFGNNYEYHDQVKSCLFPFLLSINSPLFDIQNCNFSKKNMKKKEDGDINKSKDGTGRVAMFAQYGVIRSYTIEANYNMCNRLNKIAFKDGALNYSQLNSYLDGTRVPYRGEILSNIGQLCRFFNFETEPARYFFKQEDYEEMGKDVGIGLLDLIDMNPISRIQNTPLKTMRNLKVYLAYLISGEYPYRYDTYLRCLINFPEKDKSSSDNLFVDYIERRAVNYDLIKGRKNHLGPPSNMTRRLIQPKMRKKKKNKNPKNEKANAKKGKANKKKNLPPLKKMMRFNTKNVNYKRRSLSSMRNKRKSDKFIKRNPRISKSKPPNKIPRKKRQVGSLYSQKNLNGFDSHNYAGAVRRKSRIPKLKPSQ